MRRGARVLEFVVVYFGLPAAVWAARAYGPRWGATRALLPVLLSAFVVVLILLLVDRGFERRRLWNWAGLRRTFARFPMLFIAPAGVLLACVIAWEPERLFNLIRARPGLWGAVMVLYPILSVYPQEVIWRTFAFHRYEGVIGRGWPTIAATALAFGWMHVILQNWVAVVLTTAGGVWFGYTYWKSQSTAAVWFEHSVWGCFVFTIGLGTYFYGGR